MNWRPIGFTKLTVFLRYLQYHGVSTAETRQKVEVRYCHRTRETPSAGIVEVEAWGLQVRRILFLFSLNVFNTRM